MRCIPWIIDAIKECHIRSCTLHHRKVGTSRYVNTITTWSEKTDGPSNFIKAVVMHEFAQLLSRGYRAEIDPYSRHPTCIAKSYIVSRSRFILKLKGHTPVNC